MGIGNTVKWALCAAAMMAACNGSELQGKLADDIVTELQPDTVAAGEKAAVRCTVLSPDDDPVPGVATSFDAATGLEVDGTNVSSTAAGTYLVNCKSDEVGLRDNMGARLTVVPGAPARVTTVLQDPEVKVQESTNVSCIVEDAYGNVIEGVSTTVIGDAGLDINGYIVSSDEPGEYAVICKLTEGNASNVPATLTVVHGDPVSIELLASPDKPAYDLEDKVNLTWVVLDANGNIITGLPATLTPPQTPGTNDLGDNDGARQFEFVEEGQYTWTVRLDPPWDSLSDDITLICDETGPAIVLDFPERAAQIIGDGSEQLIVTGTVTDDWGDIDLFRINGDDYPLEPDGSFTYPMDAIWGVNIIDFRAKDSFGNWTDITPTFQYAQEFTSFDETDAKGINEPDGLALLLGQLFLDDGDHDKTNPNDLATLLEIIIGDLDITGLLGTGGPLLSQTFPLLDLDVIDIGILSLDFSGEATIEVSLVDPTGLGPTTVSIDSREGGIDTTIELGNPQENGLDLTLAISISIELVANWSVFGFPDSASATGAADVTSSVSASSILFGIAIDMDKPVGGDLFIDVQDVDLELVELAIDPIQDLEFTFTLDLPFVGQQSFNFNLSQLIDINAITDALLDPLTQQLLPVLLDLVTPLIETFADDILGGLLNAFELSLPFELPALFGDGTGEPKSIEIYTNLSSVDFQDDGGQIGLGFGVWSEKGIDRDPLGSINRVGCNIGVDAGFAYGWEKSLGLALKSDSINGLLFAIWWSGFLNGPLDLGGLAGGGGGRLPLDGIALELDPWAPPILNDCDDKADVLEIQIGDMWADIEADILGTPVDAGIFIDLGLQIQFAAEPDGLYINILGLSFIDIEVIEIEKTSGGFLDAEALLKDALPGLLESFIGDQSFGPIELPAFDLGGLLPGLPAGASLELGDIGIAPQQGYTVIDMNLK